MGCENQPEVLEHESMIKFGDAIKVASGDDKLKPLNVVFSNSLDESETSSDEKMSEFVLKERKKEVTDSSYVIDGNDGGVKGVKSCKRRRTEKVLEGSECVRDAKKAKVDKDEVKVTGRLLRSRTMTMTGSVKVDENSLNESVVGFKRQMEAECFDQELSRPKKKQKSRGRPPKKHGEAGLKKKIEDKHFGQFEIREVNERSQLVGQPKKKQKRRGRPPKFQSESCKQQKKMQMKEQKDKTGNLPTDINKLNGNLLIGDDVNEGIHQVQNQESEITGDHSKAKAKASNKTNNHTIIEETVKADTTKRLKNTEDRRTQQQLVRDKIVSMIMKAKWTIEYRPRQQRAYLDAVYVDPKGKTHWSVTKAYFSLQKKIEDGKADDKEVSAFTPIPVEEMNVLFRSVSKVRSDKNTKKNKRGPDISQAEYVISADSPLKKPPNKKGKDLKKRKEVQNISKVKAKKAKIQHETGVIAESVVQTRPNASGKDRQNTRKPCLVARSSSKGLAQDNDDCIYTRKRNIVSWVIDSGVIMPGGTLLYGGVGRVRNRVLEGQVTADGINCSCCNEVVDLSRFVSHGGGKLEEAFKSVYYESGSSLLMCLLDAWRKEVELTKITYNFVDVMGDDPHDDTCNICGDGGDLICCDGCPSTFHQSCLDIQNIPSGDWHCVYCCCKFCRLAACDAEMVKCCLCEEKFHPSCFEEGNELNGNSCSLSFCGRKCQELYERLQTYIGVKFELKDGYSWSLLKRFDLSQDLDYDPMKVECNSRLAVAFSVMDECFVPVIDERSGVNRIHNVVYNCGSNFKRLDYSGFYTAILEKGGEVISVASIRIRDNWLAEMPFIGTRNMYRRQGMCRRLLDAIEGALGSLGVGELVIPAIPELFQTWTKVFGFEPLDELLRQETKNMSLIVFPGTDMLHKPLFKNEFADEIPSPVAGDKAVERVILEVGENTLYSKNKSPNAIADERKSIGLVNDEVTGVKMSHSTSKVVPKNSFDLNLQPAATDIDAQLVYEESISSNPQVRNVSG